MPPAYTSETVNGDRFLELCALAEHGEIEFDGNFIVVGLASYRVAWRRTKKSIDAEQPDLFPKISVASSVTVPTQSPGQQV